MDLFPLNPILVDSLLNNALSAVLLTLIATLAIWWVPNRLPRLQGNIIIGVFIALLVLPILRFGLPETGTVLSLRSTVQSAPVTERTPSTPSPHPSSLIEQDLLVLEEFAREFVSETPPIPESNRGSLWAPLAIALWALGVVVALIRLLIGWLRLQRLAKALPPVSDPALHALWRKVAGAEADTIHLVDSTNHTALFAFGCRHPRVAVPSDLLSRSTEAEALSLLTHEWAHIRNGDVLLGHFQRGLASLYWWLPPVHWLNKRLSLSRETLADTAAAARVDSPTLYAYSLLNLAAQACRKESPAMGVIGIAGSRSALAQRLITLSKHYEQMKTNLQNPHPFRAPLAILGLCSLCLGVQFTYAQESGSSAPSKTTSPIEESITEAPSADQPSVERATQHSVPVESTDADEAEMELRAAKSEIQRALSDMKRELSDAKQELSELKKQLSEERRSISASNQSEDANNPNSYPAKLMRDGLNDKHKQAETTRGIAEGLAKETNKIHNRTMEDEVALLREQLAAIDKTALHEQTHALHESVKQVVTEALRAATAELRKELEKLTNPESSSDFLIEY